MAGKEKIATDERVFAEAERLVQEGASPSSVSYRQVAALIGGGSATTITSALRRWREKQGIAERKRRGRPAAEEQTASRGLEQRLMQLQARKNALKAEALAVDAEIAQVEAAIEVGLAELMVVIKRYSLTQDDLQQALVMSKKGEEK